MSELSFDLRFDVAGRSRRMAARLPAEGVTVLTGPSGAGKTTLLRAIAGLIPSEGEVRAGETRLDRHPVHRRGIGYVFQEQRLFPHLDVAGNIAFGARRRGGDPGPVIEALGLSDLLDRRPATLSGGEARRVALARALAARPALILLDEPLAGLDDARKAELLPWLYRGLAHGGVPSIYVTHASSELLTLADRVLRVEDGHLSGPHPGPARLPVRRDRGAWRIGDVVVPLRLDRANGWELAFGPGDALLSLSHPGPGNGLVTLAAEVTGSGALKVGGHVVAWRPGGARPISWPPGTRVWLTLVTVWPRPCRS